MNTERIEEQENNPRRYLQLCLMCKKSLVNNTYSISYCSELCRHKWGIKIKTSSRRRIANPQPSKCPPGICRKCGIPLGANGKKKTKAIKKGLCRKACDGIQRDRGGFPLAANLRLKYIQESKIKKLNKKPSIAPKPKTPIQSPPRQQESVPFYETREWREIRYQAIKLNGRRCQACFATDKRIHVDHIKPRSKYPELSLQLSNLQVLCEDCNLGKSNKDETDWRPKQQS